MKERVIQFTHGHQKSTGQKTVPDWKRSGNIFCKWELDVAYWNHPVVECCHTLFPLIIKDSSTHVGSDMY
jgi:hypothetical protein